MTAFFQNLQTASNQKLYRSWVIATVCGFWLGQIAIRFLLAVVVIPLSNAGSGVGQFAIHLMPIIFGLVLGILQWIVIRPHFNKAYWWIVATTLGNLLGLYGLFYLFGGILDALADPTVPNLAALLETRAAYNIVQTFASGLGLGLCQWLYLRKRLSHTASWIGAVIIATFCSWLISQIPVPQIAPPSNNPADLFEIFQPSTSTIALQSLFGIARIALIGVVTGSITGLWIVDFTTRLSALRQQPIPLQPLANSPSPTDQAS